MKYYSSGMVARLAFSVAVNLQPDILLMDEVLAVGDQSFQEKCLDRLREYRSEGVHDGGRLPRCGYRSRALLPRGMA